MLLLTLTVAASGCSQERERAAPRAPEVLTGVVVGVDARRVGDVESFELKSGPEVHTIHIDDAIDYGFPLGHLNEHVATADPVRVELEERGAKLYATEIEDR